MVCQTRTNSGMLHYIKKKRPLTHASHSAAVFKKLFNTAPFDTVLGRHPSVADPGENLTGALHSNIECGGCGRRGLHRSWIYAMMLLSKTQ